MTEAEVTKDIIDYLTDRGWRCLRMQSGVYRGRNASRVKVGEIGMADWMVIHYRLAYEHYLGPPHTREGIALFWLEVKGTGKPLRKGQPEWIKAEEEKGALVCVADSLESLQAWYEEVYG